MNTGEGNCQIGSHGEFVKKHGKLYPFKARKQRQLHMVEDMKNQEINLL